MKDLILDVQQSLKAEVSESVSLLGIFIDVDNFGGADSSFFDVVAVVDGGKRYHCLYQDDSKVSDWRECRSNGGK